jgi:hypothetical protein
VFNLTNLIFSEKTFLSAEATFVASKTKERDIPYFIVLLQLQNGQSEENYEKS